MNKDDDILYSKLDKIVNEYHNAIDELLENEQEKIAVNLVRGLTLHFYSLLSDKDQLVFLKSECGSFIVKMFDSKEAIQKNSIH
jgi:hypothetical protein